MQIFFVFIGILSYHMRDRKPKSDSFLKFYWVLQLQTNIQCTKSLPQTQRLWFYRWRYSFDDSLKHWLLRKKSSVWLRFFYWQRLHQYQSRCWNRLRFYWSWDVKSYQRHEIKILFKWYSKDKTIEIYRKVTFVHLYHWPWVIFYLKQRKHIFQSERTRSYHHVKL